VSGHAFIRPTQPNFGTLFCHSPHLPPPFSVSVPVFQWARWFIKFFPQILHLKGVMIEPFSFAFTGPLCSLMALLPKFPFKFQRRAPPPLPSRISSHQPVVSFPAVSCLREFLFPFHVTRWLRNSSFSLFLSEHRSLGQSLRAFPPSLRLDPLAGEVIPTWDTLHPLLSTVFIPLNPLLRAITAPRLNFPGSSNSRFVLGLCSESLCRHHPCALSPPVLSACTTMSFFSVFAPVFFRGCPSTFDRIRPPFNVPPLSLHREIQTGFFSTGISSPSAVSLLVPLLGTAQCVLRPLG